MPRPEEPHVERSPNIADLQPSATIAVSSLAKKLQSEGRDIINLSAGEPDFDTPAWISDAAIQGIRNGRTKYTPAPGMPELRKAIAGYLGACFDREFDWQGVVVSAGAKQSLFNTCFSLFGPGDEVVVGAPYWTSYPEILTLARATAVPTSGDESNGFKLTASDLDRVKTDRTKGLVFSNPGNPSGTVYTKQELREVAEWCRDNGVWLIADEIYREIFFADDADRAPSILDLPPTSLGDWVLIDGASKSFAMTGWRIGFAYSSRELASQMTSLQSHVSSNAATPSQVAALAAYTDRARTAAAVSEMRVAFRRRAELVKRLFDEKLPQFPYLSPDGAFYLFFRVDSAFREGRATASELCSWLLEEVGVALVPGEAFGDPRYVRLSYATSDSLIEQAVDRLASIFAD